MPSLSQGGYSAGAFHSLVVSWQGELLAWGNNSFGQVGDGSVVDRDRPVQLLRAGIAAVAAGKAHSLAVTERGEVLAWGSNENNLLGTGGTEKQLVPARVIESGIRAVSAGFKHSLALTDDGEVLAWGSNEYGQLGPHGPGIHSSPLRVPLPGRVKAISAGWYHSLALLENGAVYTWGFNTPDRTGFRNTGQPTAVLLRGIESISAGGVHSLALTETGIALAWGGGEKGQIGDGQLSKQTTPVPIADHIQHVAAGGYHSLAVDLENHVLVWGFHAYGLPGTGGEDPWRVELRPQIVPLDVDTFAVFSVSAGGGHSLAVSYDGEIFSWGGNSSGQVGDRTREDRELPKMIIGTGFVKLRSHEEMVDSMMKNNAKAVDDDDAEASRSRPGSGRCLSAAGAAVVGRAASGPPQLLLRAAGVSGGQRALLMTLQAEARPASAAAHAAARARWHARAVVVAFAARNAAFERLNGAL
eukprot:CAMPEP_0204167680 /NCGR_PEP_ID=MMETSP0361-20130328/40069_1 /ASSEMBLY_ACC=CAM_ASM_000343 /TAXON_ID=268821 /ORGANISM="Scrippsiella Hangoei, Strain SHTV-5" /LENGTH=470 /DNA_ID=CAMNT_0051125037 /DNA_START=23 /DNA_END=1430 /DNA_ORIENTATION=+